MAGLSRGDASAVTTSWNALKGDWNSKLGEDFLIKLFIEYPNIRTTFPYGALSDAETRTNDRFKGHVVNFGKVIQALVDNLENEGGLSAAINKLADDHVDRGLTDMKDFNNAFNFLHEFLVANGASGGDAWEKTVKAVATALGKAFKAKGK